MYMYMYMHVCVCGLNLRFSINFALNTQGLDQQAIVPSSREDWRMEKDNSANGQRTRKR